MTIIAARALLTQATQKKNLTALERLRDGYDALAHESNCARRFHGASECTCIKSDILVALDEAGLELP